MAKGGFSGGRMSGGMNMNMIKQAQKMQQDITRRALRSSTAIFAAQTPLTSPTIRRSRQSFAEVRDSARLSSQVQPP